MSENPTGFKAWKDSFKKTAIENNISEQTFDTVMAITVSNVCSEILFSIAVFLKLSFHALNPVGFSDIDGVKLKNMNINK